jgi:hypothetical protein
MIARILAMVIIAAIAIIASEKYYAHKENQYQQAMVQYWKKDQVIARTAAIYYVQGQSDAVAVMLLGEKYLEQLKEARNLFIVQCAIQLDENSCREEWLKRQPKMIRDEKNRRQQEQEDRYIQT